MQTLHIKQLAVILAVLLVLAGAIVQAVRPTAQTCQQADARKP